VAHPQREAAQWIAEVDPGGAAALYGANAPTFTPPPAPPPAYGSVAAEMAARIDVAASGAQPRRATMAPGVPVPAPRPAPRSSATLQVPPQGSDWRRGGVGDDASMSAEDLRPRPVPAPRRFSAAPSAPVAAAQRPVSPIYSPMSPASMWQSTVSDESVDVPFITASDSRVSAPPPPWQASVSDEVIELDELPAPKLARPMPVGGRDDDYDESVAAQLQEHEDAAIAREMQREEVSSVGPARQHTALRNERAVADACPLVCARGLVCPPLGDQARRRRESSYPYRPWFMVLLILTEIGLLIYGMVFNNTMFGEVRPRPPRRAAASVRRRHSRHNGAAAGGPLSWDSPSKRTR